MDSDSHESGGYRKKNKKTGAVHQMYVFSEPGLYITPQHSGVSPDNEAAAR